MKLDRHQFLLQYDVKVKINSWSYENHNKDELKLKWLPATKAIISDTQHQQSLQQIWSLENRPHREPVEPAVQSHAPYFTQPLNFNPLVNEGDHVTLQCRIQPENDPRLTVEFLHNNQPLASGHRTKLVHNFGFISLDILDAKFEDAGVWTCLCRNDLGSCQSSCEILVKRLQNLILDSQHPSSLPIIHQLEAPKPEKSGLPDKVYGQPNFTVVLKDLTRLEGQSAHFETRLVPVDDPKMQLDWFHNGRPLILGNRFKTLSDFGYVSLDISYTFPEDSGIYAVRAKNDQGEAVLEARLLVHGEF